MKKNAISLLSITIVASLITAVQAQVKWVRLVPSEASANAARAVGDNDRYLCRGTYAERPDSNMP